MLKTMKFIQGKQQQFHFQWLQNIKWNSICCSYIISKTLCISPLHLAFFHNLIDNKLGLPTFVHFCCTLIVSMQDLLWLALTFIEKIRSFSQLLQGVFCPKLNKKVLALLCSAGKREILTWKANESDSLISCLTYWILANTNT